MSSSGRVVDIDSLTIGYDLGRSLLEGITLHIDAGEVVTVVGPSGVGKTTLVRELICSSPATKSSRTFNITKSDGDKGARISYVPQGGGIFEWMSAYQNIVAGSWGAHDQARKTEVCHLASRLGLASEVLHRDASRLSGGERQRVALARAFLRRSDLYVLDEPFSELDFRLRFSCYELVESNITSGGAMLLITHDLVEAALLSTRILVLGLSTKNIVKRIDVPINRPRDHRGLLRTNAVGRAIMQLQDAFDACARRA